MCYFHAAVVRALAPHLPMAPAEIATLLTAPPDPALGDVAFPCFAVAKELRKAPQAIAAELATQVTVPAPLAGVSASGPYLNFRLERAQAGARLLADVLAAGDTWGGDPVGAGHTVCIDFCSPNVARRMHLGHLRSTVIGKALVRLHQAMGYMGVPGVEGLEHVGFGVMLTGGKRLRTRQGDVVYLEDVLEQAIGTARAELEARSPGMAGAGEIARAIGVGAVIFNDLKQHRHNDVDFNPAEALSFDGETGPYIQYAHARCRNVLRKAGVREGELTATPHTTLGGEAEWSLLTAIGGFPQAVRQAAERCQPHLLARSVLDVAQALSRFYHDCPVLRAEPDVRACRLALVAAAATTLRRGLWALGLEAPPMREE